MAKSLSRQATARRPIRTGLGKVSFAIIAYMSRQVLKDTTTVIQECGGALESGSEHRGTYRFPTHSARRECHRVLLEYQEQLDGVLDGAGAPHVKLFFRKL